MQSTKRTKAKSLIIDKNGISATVLDYTEVKKAAMYLRAINHELRQRILEVIKQEGTVHVTKIYIKLRLEQSVASQHLAILRQAGYVKTKRDGKFIRYSLNKERVVQVAQLVSKLNRY